MSCSAHLEATVDEALVEQLLEHPPHALHERGVQRLVVVLQWSWQCNQVRLAALRAQSAVVCSSCICCPASSQFKRNGSIPASHNPS